MYQTFAYETMTLFISEANIKEKYVTIMSNHSSVHSNHYIRFSETELREMRKFLTIQIRKLKNNNHE